jgi:hypothetical protein
LRGRDKFEFERFDQNSELCSNDPALLPCSHYLKQPLHGCHGRQMYYCTVEYFDYLCEMIQYSLLMFLVHKLRQLTGHFTPARPVL